MNIRNLLKTISGKPNEQPQEFKKPRNPLLEKLIKRIDASDKFHHGQQFEKKDILEDGVPVWDVNRGTDYGEFWKNVGAIKSGALMVTRGQIVDEETDTFMCQDVAEMIHCVLKLKPSSKVLEVGSGIGSIAIHIAPKVGEYTMADISPTMLERASERLKGIKGVSTQILEKCDLSPFVDQSFDAVLFEAVLVHMDREDAYRYMRETFRVLKPGGRAYFEFYNLLHPNCLSRFHFVHEHMCDGKGRNVVSRARFHTSSEVRAYLGLCGFQIDEENSQLSDVPPDPLIHLEEDVLTAVCVKPFR